MTETRRPCPYCAEPIAAEAIRCPHCRSRVVALDPTVWHRDHAERKVAGVAAAVARAFAVPVALVRAGFVLLSFVHLVGIMTYAALWVVIPRRPGEPSPFDRLARRARDVAEAFLTGHAGHPPSATTPPPPAWPDRDPEPRRPDSTGRPLGPTPIDHTRPAA